MILHRPMLVGLIGEPTDDDRMIESLAFEPGDRFPVRDPKGPRESWPTVRLRIRGNRIEAIVPRWWRRQLTLDLDSSAVQFWDRPDSPEAPPLWVFVAAPVVSLYRGGELPPPWGQKVSA